MKIYAVSVAGETNAVFAFRSKREAQKKRAELLRDAHAGETVFDVEVYDFPISARGLLDAFQCAADNAPN